MRALVKSRAERGLWLEHVPEPKPGINDVLIRVLMTGICGTDLHIFHGYANSEGRKKEEHLIDYLKKKGALPYRDIYRALNMSSKELMDSAKPLAQAGVICFRKIGTKDGITLL